VRAPRRHPEVISVAELLRREGLNFGMKIEEVDGELRVADPGAVPQAKSNATNIHPALNHESRMRFDAMMISPVVESTCVTAAA
jgi:hypothetical protein